MDTKKWGPSGWKLLHLISYQYPVNPTSIDKKNIKEFFELLKYLLPCKYCRISIIKFYNEIPIEQYYHNKKKMIEFVYLIHNKVNDKLRDQGLLKNYHNPQLKDVNKYYNIPVSFKVSTVHFYVKTYLLLYITYLTIY